MADLAQFGAIGSVWRVEKCTCSGPAAPEPRRQWVPTGDGGYRLSGEAWELRPGPTRKRYGKRYPWLLVGPDGEESEIGPKNLNEALRRAEFSIEIRSLIRLPG